MTIEFAGALIYFVLTVFGLLFSMTKSSHIDGDNFPNRGRFYSGLIIWVLSAILAVFMSFPGYSEWFIPAIYPLLKSAFVILFVAGFFMVLTTLIAFPQHLNYYRREIDGRSDRIALLENIRQIASQPYPITELFTLVLKELGSFLIIQKGAVFMINPSRREMYLAAQIGLDKEEQRRLERFSMGRDIITQAAIDQSPFISGDLASSDSASRKLLLAGRDLTLSAAALPLSSRDRSLGTLLVLSDKPYRFEKRDRMLLMAAAEAMAGVVEANRLSRDNQKLTRGLEELKGRLETLREGLNEAAKNTDYQKVLSATCHSLVESYNALACRVIRVDAGELIDIARYDTDPASSSQSESYRIAVIDAIRRKKMVVLNQEAKGQGGSTYISRTALLCPFSVRVPGEYALLLEAPGNGLPLDDRFLAEMESILNLATVAINSSGTKDSDPLNQTAAKSLLRILKIQPDMPQREIFEYFIGEINRLPGIESSALIFIRDKDNLYRILDGKHVTSENLAETAFMPGEGPIGKVAATAETIEFSNQSQLEAGWSGLDQVNQDFLNHLGGEKGIPDYQLNIPVTVLNDVVAVISIFSHETESRPTGKERAILLLAAQLLSIRMSMAHIDNRRSEDVAAEMIHEAGPAINDINNDLATIMGQAELLEHQTDISGQTRYAAGEIIKAAEQAAKSLNRLQESKALPESLSPEKENELTYRLNRFLDSHRVTGDLYMFENNRTVMLRNGLTDPSPFVLPNNNLSSFLEKVLEYFIALQEEGDEVFLKSQLCDDYFYLSLIRGSQEKHRSFDPTVNDFGAPDVLPRDIVDGKMIQILDDHHGEVSFDRFGRQPTYLSFRFPSANKPEQDTAAAKETPVAGLKILAIDDQQMILDLLSGICNSLGLNLTALRNPAQGAELFRRQHFDIVMVDLAIGQVSGWDIAREVKRHAPETPVIMMTGWGMDIEPEKAASAGVDFTLAKPFRVEQLTEVIMQARTKLLSS